MTSDERERAVDYLERTKAALLDSTVGLTEAQWRFKSADDAWSVAECVEHIAVVETSLLRTIQKLAQGPPASPEMIAEMAGKEQRIIKLVPSRRGKVTAPEAVRPANRFADSSALVAYLVEARDRSIHYARTTTDPLRSLAHPHMVFGPLDGYQWLIFMAAHSERHLAQAKEVMQCAGFPS